jgi:hypothetical protein
MTSRLWVGRIPTGRGGSRYTVAKLPELLRKPLSTHFRYDLNSGHFAALR